MSYHSSGYYFFYCYWVADLWVYY